MTWKFQPFLLQSSFVANSDNTIWHACWISGRFSFWKMEELFSIGTHKRIWMQTLWRTCGPMFSSCDSSAAVKHLCLIPAGSIRASRLRHHCAPAALPAPFLQACVSISRFTTTGGVAPCYKHTFCLLPSVIFGVSPASSLSFQVSFQNKRRIASRTLSSLASRWVKCSLLASPKLASVFWG